MAEVAKKYQDELKKIKENIELSYSYFRPNIDRYNEFTKLVCQSGITDTEKAVLDTLKKPQIESNMLPAKVDRLLGEFSKQEPSIEVMADDDATIDPEMIKLIEGHMRHILVHANNDSFEYTMYKDLLLGGFSVAELFTDYSHKRSFNQMIGIRRVYDPTLCGFDPLAILPHKGDGDYCFKLYPKRKEDFAEEFPRVDIKEVKFSRHLGAFNWSYRSGKDDILLVGEYYKKKKKRVKIVKLANGLVIVEKEYKRLIEMWGEEQMIAQPPAIINERWVNDETICRYLLIENQIISVEETDFPIFPLIFFDGNSAIIKDTPTGNVQQMTIPYVYHAKGIQKLKNFAMQTLACEIENMVMHKFMVAEEALPENEDYLKAWTNWQVASTLVHKAYKDNDPNAPVPPPQPVPRVNTPPEVMGAFTMADQALEGILGAYDASLGINDNQLSGVAIVEGATQSNAAAMPYIVGYMHSLNWAAQGILQLIPKYYVTPRTIPIVDLQGKKTYVKINGEGNIKFDYGENALQIKVSAGVNFEVQKQKALQTMIYMANSMPSFNEFLNARCMPQVLDNLSMRGIDSMKVLWEQWAKEQEEMKKKQQEAQMQAMQNDPRMIKAQTEQKHLELDAAQMQADMKMDAAKLGIEQMHADNERLRIMMEAGDAHAERMIKKEKHDTENFHSATELAIKAASEQGHHHRELTKLQHEILSANKESKGV